MKPGQAQDILRKAVENLGEHFDSVQIMATWSEDSITHLSNNGCGNWYARQGMAHEFINSDIAQDQARQIAKSLQDQDDDQ